MRHGFALTTMIVALGACSGGSGGSGGGAYNDTTTGARLMRERPLGNGTPAERVTRLAECSATLRAAADGPPPHARAEYMRRAAERYQTLATQLAGRSGQTAADVTRIRDETAAANRQLAQNEPQLYAQLIGPAVDACGIGEVMTDQELSG